MSQTKSKDAYVKYVLVLILLGNLCLPNCEAFNLPKSLGVRLAVRGSKELMPPVTLRVPQKQMRSRIMDSEQPRALTSKLQASATTAELGGSSNRISFPLVLWRFTRPHTLIGSGLAIPAIHALAAPSWSALFSVPCLVAMVYAMIPSLLMNLYITGLNQITDVEIDKINKPNLPIAAGDLSMKDAIWVVIIALVGSIWMGCGHAVLGSQGLNVALWGSGILGTMYSLPPFRLKRFPLLAAFCIVAVRGTIINAGFFAHAKSAAFGGQTSSVLHYLMHDRACMLSSLFFGVFGVVIALMKDVPDVEGDELARVRTFSVRVGQKRIFHTMKRLLTALFLVYGFGFARAAFSANAALLSLSRMTVSALAFCAGFSVRKKATDVNPEDSEEVYGYYMHLWKLFYLSYLALPFAN